MIEKNNETVDENAYVKVNYKETYYRVDQNDSFFTLQCMENGMR